MEDAGPSLLARSYFEHKAAILRFLTARLGDRHAAEDLSQDLYIKLQTAEISGDVGDPVSYLYRMALNLARDYRRGRQRARVREADWVDTRATVMGTETIVDAPSAEASYAAKQRLAAVRAALEELSPQCRRVFVLHKFDGLSHAEIAQHAGISPSTVEKHMRTALLHLISRLGRD